MPLDALLTLAVLIAAVVVLNRESVPVGIVALAAPLVLVVTGVLEPGEMWSGFAHPAVVAVGAMMIVSAGISRTGALESIGHGLARLHEHGERYVLFALATATALMSAFTNNTTVVLVCLPIVLTLCQRQGYAPSRLLLPLSFASIFGGMTTLVGTSTNIIVAEVGMTEVQAVYGKTLFEPGMWDFTAMGSIFAVTGIIYLVVMGPKLLPHRVALSMTLSRGTPTEYFTEADVTPGSSLVGKTLGEVVERYGIHAVELIRHDVVEAPMPETELAAGDIILLRGAPAEILDFSSRSGAALLPDLKAGDITTKGVDLTLAEVIVPPNSRWIHRRVDAIGFRARFGVNVIAVQRHGHHVRQKVGELRVAPADMLLVQGTPESLRNIRTEGGLILVEGVDEEVPFRDRAPHALGILLLFVALVAILHVDLAVAAMAAAIGMVLVRCLTMQQAFSSFDWNVLFLLAGFLSLGTALEKSGLAHDAAEVVMTTLADAPPWVLVASLYLFTAFLSDLVTNAAVAALMCPIVVQTAKLMDTAPGPLLMTVAFAASAAFLTPMGYQTNLLVYGPGGYRIIDYLRLGLPLRFIFAVLAAALIPVFYPF